MSNPLDYETPKVPAKRRPFWPPGWRRTDVVILLVVFLGSALADDYLAAIGWPRWVRLLAEIVVLYIAWWVSSTYFRDRP